MKLEIQIHASEEAKEVVKRITEENLDKKLSSYLKQFDGKDTEGRGDLKIKKTNKGYSGVLQLFIDGKTYRYSRENFKNLDDLVNHLFDHFKEELSSR